VSSWESSLQRVLDTPSKRTGTFDSCYGFLMLELNRTVARAAFKDLLGQANHFLITILVGLNGVRRGGIEIDEEFRTSWNPRDVRHSADRSRAFALDLALVRAVDSLDTYMMRSRRHPLALTSTSFASSMDGAGQSISRRLEVFNAHLDPLPNRHTTFIKLAIEWRNRRVHSLADNNIDDDDIDSLEKCADTLHKEFSGLDVVELIKDYKSRSAPTFKEAAAIMRLVHFAVENFDTQLLGKLDINRYLGTALAAQLGGNGQSVNISVLSHSCRQIWDHPTKKKEKILRALRLIGVHPTGESKRRGRAVPDELIDQFLEMRSADAMSLLTSSAD
jgi:hypothetical protein